MTPLLTDGLDPLVRDEATELEIQLGQVGTAGGQPVQALVGYPRVAQAHAGQAAASARPQDGLQPLVRDIAEKVQV